MRKLSGGPDRLVEPTTSRWTRRAQCLALAPNGDRVASIDTSREVRIWSLRPGEAGAPRVLKGMGNLEDQSPALSTRAARAWPGGRPTTAPCTYGTWTLPGMLSRSGCVARTQRRSRWSAFTPNGKWLAVMDGSSAMLWPVGARHPYVLRGHTRGPVPYLAFTADSQWLTSGSFDGARLWPMASRGASGYPNDRVREGWIYGDLRTAPSGAAVLVAGHGRRESGSNRGDPVHVLGNTWGAHVAVTGAIGFEPTGRRVAWASGYAPDPADRVLRVWDLQSGKEWVWPLCGDCDKSKPYDRGIYFLRFAPDGSLLAGGFGGVRRWNVETGESQPVLDAPFAALDASRDGRLLLISTGELVTRSGCSCGTCERS